MRKSPSDGANRRILWGWVKMILTRALLPACVKVPLEGMDKDSVITELVDLLDQNGSLPDRNSTLEEVLSREQIRSTGVGFGIAIPHGRSATVSEPVMAVGITHTPVDFDSVDGRPVSIVVLLLSPRCSSTRTSERPSRRPGPPMPCTSCSARARSRPTTRSEWPQSVDPFLLGRPVTTWVRRAH
jgi:mannitol/fructose-specific phosphotransferase system IIA component (Ntr-type)